MRLAIGTTAALWVIGLCAAGAQAPADRPPMSEEVFKNVQILKGIPVDQFMGTMGFFSSSLGLNLDVSWRSYENVAHYCRCDCYGSTARRPSRCRDLRYRERAHAEGNRDGMDLGQSSLFPEI